MKTMMNRIGILFIAFLAVFLSSCSSGPSVPSESVREEILNAYNAFFSYAAATNDSNSSELDYEFAGGRMTAVLFPEAEYSYNGVNYEFVSGHALYDTETEEVSLDLEYRSDSVTGTHPLSVSGYLSGSVDVEYDYQSYSMSASDFSLPSSLWV